MSPFVPRRRRRFLDFVLAARAPRRVVYPRAMQDRNRKCQIIYVRERQGGGWKWRVVSSSGPVETSERAFDLFYECVVAARERGYEPAGVLPEKAPARRR